MLENALTILPLVPKGFTILTALFHRPSGIRQGMSARALSIPKASKGEASPVKNRAKGTVALKHWMVEFI